MKLRSIALAGLLGASLVMTSGCDKDDVDDFLSANVIYTVNGINSQVTFSVTSDGTSSSSYKKVVPHVLAGERIYTVSYNNGTGTHEFAHGSVYTYTSTNDCGTTKYLAHEVDAERVNIINLGTPLNSSDSYVEVFDSQGNSIAKSTESIGKCTVGAVASLKSIKVENDMTINVTINGVVTDTYKLTDLNSKLLSLANSIKVDIVLLADGSATLVALAGYDELI